MRLACPVFVFRYHIPPVRTVIGLRVKDGVVLAVEKLVHSKLLMPGANRRIQTIDRHIGLVRSPMSTFDPCSPPNRLALGSWQMDAISPTERETRPLTIVTTIASQHLSRFFYSRTASSCPDLTTSCPGVVRPSKSLRTGIYPLLFRPAIWV